MKIELFPFQQKAVTDLRVRVASALGMYRNTHIPQVVSLQAPTGSGKTIIMAALIEDIYFGTENYAEQESLQDRPESAEDAEEHIEEPTLF